MIEACTPERRAAAVESNNNTHTQRAPLSAAQRHNNIVDGYNDLIDMLHFTFLPGYGCIHLRSEWYLFNGYLAPLTEVLLQESCQCVDRCHVCKGSYKKYIVSVVYEGSISFLRSS